MKMTFDDWISWVFDHEVCLPDTKPWFFGPEGGAWDPEFEPSITLSYLSQFFGHPEKLIDRFLPEQIAQGLWFLCDPSASSHFFTLLDQRQPLANRLDGLKKVESLYSKLLVRLCLPKLSHTETDPATRSSINTICYMFWSVVPLSPNGNNDSPNPSDAVCMDVMESILSLDHIACQESALHGLGLWQQKYPANVEKIIQQFLNASPLIHPELINYANRALKGCV